MWDLSHLPLIVFFRLKTKKTWEAELLVYFKMLAKLIWTKTLCSSSKQDCLFFVWSTKIPNMYHANSKVEESKNWNYRKLGLFFQWREIFDWKMFELKIALVCIFFLLKSNSLGEQDYGKLWKTFFDLESLFDKRWRQRRT